MFTNKVVLLANEEKIYQNLTENYKKKALKRIKIFKEATFQQNLHSKIQFQISSAIIESNEI